MEKDKYQVICIHQEKVLRSKQRLAEVKTDALSSFFNVLAEENRLKIVYALAYETELCVCDLASIIEATIATTSHHLQSLKKLGVVSSRKEGKMAYYAIQDTSVVELVMEGLAIKGAVLV